MSLPVGTKVRTLVPLSSHAPGTETVIAGSRADTMPFYDKPVGAIFAFMDGGTYDYALDILGVLGRHVLVTRDEVEAVE